MFLILILEIFLISFTLADHLNRPLLQELSVPKNLKENQTLRLLCVLTQGEKADFKWFHNDHQIVDSKTKRIKLNDDLSELIIKSLSFEDLGEYKCISSNKYGNDVQKISLHFNVKPRWTSDEPQNLIDQLSNEITLECNAKAFPQPTTRWLKLDENKQKVTKEFQLNKINFRLTKESAGFYKCSSFNSVGSIEKIIRVGYFEFKWTQGHYVAAMISGVLVFWCSVIIISTRKYKRYVELCLPIINRRF